MIVPCDVAYFCRLGFFEICTEENRQRTSTLFARCFHRHVSVCQRARGEVDGKAVLISLFLFLLFFVGVVVLLVVLLHTHYYDYHFSSSFSVCFYLFCFQLSLSLFSLLYVEFYEYILVIVSAVASFHSQRAARCHGNRKISYQSNINQQPSQREWRWEATRETECLKSTPIIDWTSEVCLNVRRHSASRSSASIKGGRRKIRRSLHRSFNARKCTKVRSKNGLFLLGQVSLAAVSCWETERESET